MRLVPIVAAAIFVAASAPAAASGGLGCEAKDAHVDFNIDTAVTRGMGGPFFNFKAALAIALEGVPDDLRHLDFDDALTHSWLDGKAVKLQFYAERQEGDFASVGFVVETAMVEEGLYRGEYTLTVFAPESPAATETGELSATGAVVCYVE
jgi:hypothetical protein